MGLNKKQIDMGVPFEDEEGSGVAYCGKKHYHHKKVPKIKGPKYRKDGCTCELPPWELCDPYCEYRIK